ncbi:MAG: hypothetical protein A3F82_03780 [Deltaproteobacteria bacterium RIFCSPLOWO2_12_FULL_44_12]|uniref:tRNA-dihydrouridine synthase n=1 Tax=Candidatus Uhrbacteria bacterium RIFCSPLOWO2_01_FULL_47_25 TaxID=1802402 RepID=A0A1F7UWJ0_9BACT|nr:MAG: tRNA-dihydrouridine synthase [Parcubacteria group bacterium GW2011_GWA2_46_9]OGL60284.1 MAG: hypothetical protein A2752_02715 [Candidatus Uhrbacteria bacterium RIFCSPHIGHO2_01_FULL_46_23]OGL69783.1 MAG: hypothetical protein A3D60_00470 [Candidatus Uhrbacteria bacterium RIFCSPHIGHO2_02_FULL_47_29]OGL76305.1 MAG: hypothetical protein A3E96_01520 [Candidatus Uhrbacteria bacterium RIFCSPHIGHO2_12_FULL_46_13]OGL82650.1 MAG: hypothetical protein A2936_02225 [Candidatus Uhrbacteria bacterium R
MNKNFWSKLVPTGHLPKKDKQPFFVLAPMANVTDAAFRRLIAKYGKPDVFYTEFVSADGLCSKGKEKLLVDLLYTKKEHPIVAQIFGANPKKIYEASALIKKLGFDGVDINMGCPDRAVEKQGAGAALIKNPKLARELIQAAKDGAKGLPISIKTRIGYNRDELDAWLPELLAAEPAAIIIHARTRKEMSKVPARWEVIAQAVDMAKGSGVLIIGNGDVGSLEEGQSLAKETGADGIMIGRGVFGNPWMFNKKINPSEISFKNKLEVLVEHTLLFQKLLGEVKNFNIMKKHYKAYVTGFDGAKELRMRLMAAKNAAEVETVIKAALKKLSVY